VIPSGKALLAKRRSQRRSRRAGYRGWRTNGRLKPHEQLNPRGVKCVGEGLGPSRGKHGLDRTEKNRRELMVAGSDDRTKTKKSDNATDSASGF